MPKSQFVNPDQMRRKGVIEFAPISLNQYDRTVREELERLGKNALLRIQRDMEIRTTEPKIIGHEKQNHDQAIAKQENTKINID